MVDPALTGAIKDAETIAGKGLDTYGEVGHRVTWPKPIDGADTALVDDCMDTSKSGAYETSTGNKTSVGVARLHMQGSLVKGPDGIWRVQQTYFLKDEPC